MTPVKLSKPITANGEEVSELQFRDPTGEDVINYGLPMMFNEDGMTDIKMNVVAKYVQKLASIPLSSVRQIAPSDMAVLAVTVAGFFGEPEPASPSPDSSLSEN